MRDASIASSVSEEVSWYVPYRTYQDSTECLGTSNHSYRMPMYLASLCVASQHILLPSILLLRENTHPCIYYDRTDI